MQTQSASIATGLPDADFVDGTIQKAAGDPFPVRSPIYFPVETRPVSVADPRGLPQRTGSYQAVVRTDTQELLGIHSRSYKVVPNEPLFRGFDEALRASNLHVDGLIIDDHVNYGGRRAIRHYRFPCITTEPRIGDIVELRISVVNSFDCANAFSAQVGGMRLWCLNGAVSLQGATSVYGRHTAGFDTGRALGKINEAIERYLLAAVDWSEWSQREISEVDARTALAAFPDLNPALESRLEQAWNTESAQAGRTVWSLYNATTRWATHTPVREASAGNRASIVLDRERRVRQFMSSRAFRRLAA